MKRTLLHFTCMALFFGVSTPVVASDWSVSGNVALTSDYVFRGFSQTDADPAIQGGFDLDHNNGFFGGIWGSNVESEHGAPVHYDGANIELDVYLGWNGMITDGGLELTAKAIRLMYPGTNTGANNTNELGLYLGYDFGPAAVRGGVNYSNDFFGLGESWYWDVGVDIPAGPTTISMHAGRSDFDIGFDYTDYSIGVSGEIAGLGLDLTYTGTDGVPGGCVKRTCDDRVIFTISKHF